MNENLLDNMPAVDFVVNVFERTYRTVLQAGEVSKRVAQHKFYFARTVVLINNVHNRSEAEALLAPLLAAGEITEAHFIEDRLDEALLRSGVSKQRIQRAIHYTDCVLVAVFLPGSPFLLYSDADVLLTKAGNWITPALRLMQQNRRVAVANPDWTPSTLATEAREHVNGFALGYGFSDQLFLVSREEFTQPIYDEWALISWRFPLSHIAPVFEQMVDAWMRRHRRLRATSLEMSYSHEAEEGTDYRKMTLIDRWKRRLMQALMKFGQRLPGDDPRYHI